MALTLETGNGVTDADSYTAVADLDTYAANYGKTLPTASADKEALLRRSYLAMNTMKWKGVKYVPQVQTGAFPRSSVVIEGYTLPSNEIPQAIKDGQMALAIEIYAEDLNPVSSRKGAVVREKVEGAVERQYAEPGASVSTSVSVRQSSAHFAPYIGGSSTIKAYRS